MRKTILKSVIYIAACLIVPFVITMCMTGNNGRGSGKDAVKTVVKQNDLFIRDMDMTICRLPGAAIMIHIII